MLEPNLPRNKLQSGDPLAVDGKGDEPSTLIACTIFKDPFATKKEELSCNWGELVAQLASPPAYSTKGDMPLLKMAAFGDLRSEKKSLRHDRNVVFITGIEGDYDGEKISIEEGKHRLETHGIRAVLYTSPSHLPDAPRWRVLAPLSKQHRPEERKALVAKLNDALGRILAWESFTLSQAFYFGQIPDREYKCYTTFDDPERGTCIDLLPGLGTGITRTTAVAGSGKKALSALVRNYQLADQMVSKLGRLLKTGDGRRELLKSYIGSKSARGLDAWEVLALVDVFVKKYFDPADPVDEADIEKIVEWATSRDEAQRASHAAIASDGSPGESPLEANPLERTPRFHPSEGVVRVPTSHPLPRSYAFADTVALGTVCALAGSGGSSKTMLMMQACIAAAAGMRLGGLQVAEGASLLYLGEEDSAERDRRIGGICEHFKVDRSLVERRMRCFAAAGRDLRLTQTAPGGNPEETGLSDEIVQHAKSLSEEAGITVTMIVIDHARLAMAGDPNDAEDVTQLTRVLTSIAQRTGAAVFLLAHSPKSVISKAGNEINAADIAGSSAFADNARSAFMLYAMRDDEAKTLDLQGIDRNQFVCLRNVKANYSPGGGAYWFKRTTLGDWGVAVLEQVLLLPSMSSVGKGPSALRQRILDKVNSKPGGVTMRALRDQAGKDGVLKASEKAVRAEIDAMLEDGLMVLRQPTAEERRVHCLGGQVREVLVAA